MSTEHRLLLCLCLLTTTLVSSHDVGRELLQNSTKEIEKEREEDALQEYYIQQATLNKEQERVLAFASEEAITVAKKVDKSGRKKQVNVFADLWENAKGVTIVKTLALLIELTPKKRIYYFEINSDAMDSAEDNGYSFKVSEAVYNALAITDPSNDHYYLLDALLFRMNQKDKKSKGSGCQYIEFLFTDAEVWAIDDGRAQQFFRGFDNKDYLPLTECFLDECKGIAAKCCNDKKAVSSGLCGCKVVDKKKKTLQCAHNLFWTAPRVIWLCGTQNCDPDQKCLCPDPKAKKKGKDVKLGSVKGKGKAMTSGKGKDDDEPKKGKVSKKSVKDTKGKDNKAKDTKGKDAKAKDTKGKSEKEVKKTSNSKKDSKTVKTSKTIGKTKTGGSKTEIKKTSKTVSKAPSKKSKETSKPIKVPKKKKSSKIDVKKTSTKKSKKSKSERTRRET